MALAPNYSLKRTFAGWRRCTIIRRRPLGRLAQALALMSNAKPVHELTARDLEDHPIWEYAMDDEDDHDETYVRPVMSSTVPQEPSVVYQAACTVTVASGKSYPGFLEICNGELHFEAPGVVGISSEDNWPLDSEPLDRHTRRKFEAYFGSKYAQLFPIRWQLRVVVSGNPGLRSGVFEG